MKHLLIALLFVFLTPISLAYAICQPVGDNVYNCSFTNNDFYCTNNSGQNFCCPGSTTECLSITSSVDTTNPTQLSELSTIVANVLISFIPLIGTLAFIMILVGGFTILTSSGNPENLEKGKKIITYAVGGIILSIISWLSLVLIESLTGVNVTTFRFGF